ncbi:MAG: hypothetical protein Q9220_000607 [cf. Caloplaca sp. 1 TL-2023]
MPVGIQRFNAHQTHPNDRIVFIKPLPGPTAALAQDFLSRIAAIVKPIMKTFHLSVTTLEEYEPNPEFAGRNFNAGEIIQLVLKAPRTGQWLSFRSVQMVMMHELAHCLQMNHGKDFWKARNQFAAELRLLWGKGYTGDGFWGKGRKTGMMSEWDARQRGGEEDVMPERLCGGTFRTRGRRRKRKRGGEELTWAEKRQKRIEKKFGTNGQLLGGEEETRVKLEDGKKPKGKPRVAGSARGRELRAAAALARFGAPKEEEEEEFKEEEKAAASEYGSETDLEDVKPEKEALDRNGSRLLDSKGRGMVKVCEGEDEIDIHVKQEMDELHDLAAIDFHERSRPPASPSPRVLKRIKLEPEESGEGIDSNTDTGQETPGIPLKREESLPITATPLVPSSTTSTSSHADEFTCPICSMSNEPSALVCTACAHVLQTRLMPDCWRCSSSVCEGSKYMNAGDCGVCGVCGGKRSSGA